MTYITPFQRLATISCQLYTDAAHKPAFHTSFHNGIFTLANGTNPPLHLPLNKVRIAVFHAMHNLKARIETALPPGITVDDFPAHLLSDDFSGTPLHTQSQNIEILQPILSKCWKQLLGGEGSDSALIDQTGFARAKSDKWLGVYDSCFPLATSAIMLTTGGMSDSCFKYQCYAGPGRTVFLLKNSVLALVKHLSSDRKINSHIDIVTVPPELTLCLLVLFTILLPVALGLRGLKGQVHPFQSTHLWTLTRRRTCGNHKWLYDCKAANESIITLTQDIFGVALSGKILHQMIQQVFKSEFPLLFNNKMPFRSPVDDLGQHRFETGVTSYGRSASFPACRYLTGDRPIRHLTYCEIWQAITKCGPINDTWKDLIENTAFFPVQYFPSLALRVARRLVLNFYGLGKCMSAQKRKERVHELLATKPFLGGISVSLIMM